MAKKQLLALSLIAGMVPGSVLAATATGTLTVSTTVASSCAVLPATLTFVSYGGSQTDGTGTITVLCTLNTPYTVALDVGANGDFTARQMLQTVDGVTTLDYNLYTDNTYTTVWGDGTGATATVAGTGTGLNANHTVYGRIPASQNVSAGTYTDTVTITVTY